MIGIFEGKIHEYGVSETKQVGNPQVFITFKFLHEGAEKMQTWYGSFVGGAKDITLKTLMYCGLTSQNFGKLTELSKGVQSNLLDLNKVLRLDIQEEPKQDGTGMRTVVQWVNDPAFAPGPKKIDEAKAAHFFGAMGFENDLVRLAGEIGIPLNNGQNQNQGQNNNGYNQAQNGDGYNQNQAQNNGGYNQNQGAQNNMQNTQNQAPNNNGYNQAQNNTPNQGGGFKAPF